MTRAEILDEAKRIVDGDRDQQYGSPEDSFSNIAALWNAYLYGCEAGSIVLDGADVGAMMILMKVARLMSSRKLDTYIDIAGYAACAGEIASRGEEDHTEPEPDEASGLSTGRKERKHVCCTCERFHRPSWDSMTKLCAECGGSENGEGSQWIEWEWLRKLDETVEGWRNQDGH